MTPAIAAGLAFIAVALAGNSHNPPAPANDGAQQPAEAASPGKRIESDSYTPPAALMRCLAYNINRKMPELHVRNRPAESPDEDGYLILTRDEASPATFGVIRIARSEDGSHLTTWLSPAGLPAAPEAVARRLVAGC